MHATARRSITAGITATALIAVLSGCAQLSQLPMFAEDVIPCSVDENHDDSVWPSREVTDEFGSYCLTELDPTRHHTLNMPIEIVDESLGQNAVGSDQADVVYHRTLETLGNVIIDSEMLDNPNIPALEWFDANAADRFGPLYRPAVERGEIGRAGVTVTGQTPQPINRTGGARAYETNITSDKIYYGHDEGQEPMLVVSATAVSKYHTTEAGLVEAAIRNGVIADEAALKAIQPSLFDGVDDDDLVITYAGVFAYPLSDLTKIAITDGTITFATGSGYNISE